MRVRASGRAVVLDAEGRVLLQKFLPGQVGVISKADAVWVTPGGALASGESYEQAARRELFEETGIAAKEPLTCIWFREVLFDTTEGRLLSRERFFLVRVREAGFSMANMPPEERTVTPDCRWWSVGEITESEEEFAPPHLAGLVAELNQGHLPQTPRRIV